MTRLAGVATARTTKERKMERVAWYIVDVDSLVSTCKCLWLRCVADDEEYDGHNTVLI